MTDVEEPQDSRAYQEARLYERREFKLGEVFYVKGARIIVERRQGRGRKILVSSLDGSVIGLGSEHRNAGDTSNSPVDDSEPAPLN